MNTLTDELTNLGTEAFTLAFNPIHQLYYEITATVEGIGENPGEKTKGIELTEVMRSLCHSHLYRLGYPIEYQQLAQQDGSLKIKSMSTRPAFGYDITISNEDLQKGYLRFSDACDAAVSKRLQKTIARHFCPCFMSDESIVDEGLVIYYHHESDRKQLSDFFSEMEGVEDYGLHFVRV